jgi:hypothetical protein
MAKRGGSAGKEWEIVKDDFFVGETKGAKRASDSLSRVWISNASRNWSR